MSFGRAAVSAQLLEALEGRPRVVVELHRLRLEDDARELSCLEQVARAPQRRDELDRCAHAPRKLLVLHPSDRLDREAADPRQVVVHVVLRDAELVEVAPHRLGRDPRVTERGYGRAELALGELATVLAEDQPVVDVLRWPGAQRLGQLAVQRLVRAVVVPADHVRDPELDVVDDAREVVRRGPVLAQERDPPEPVPSEPLRSRAVDLLAVALPERPLVPADAEPLEVAQDLLLAAGHVSRRVGVVDPQQEVVAEVAVGDGAEGVPDVERPRRARCEAHFLHAAPSLEVERVPDVERVRRILHDASLAVLAPTAALVEAPRSSVVLEHPEVTARRAERSDELEGLVVERVGKSGAPALRDDVEPLEPLLADARCPGRLVVDDRDQRPAGRVRSCPAQRARIASRGYG